MKQVAYFAVVFAGCCIPACLAAYDQPGAAGGAGSSGSGGAGAGANGAEAGEAASSASDDAGPVSPNGAITFKADESRTGWYSNQPRLDPSVVGGSSFGRLFKTPLTLTPGEQVYAQPLVFGGRVLVVTEANNVYSIDSETGAVVDSRSLDITPWNASDIGCPDITPMVGITGTPVIDTATRTAYFLSKGYRGGTQGPARGDAAWYAHALDLDSLEERPSFPLEIRGTASNDPKLEFDPFVQMQRPGLLLLDGVVYAAFGGHCDLDEFHGWVVGIGSEGRIRTLFATEAGPGTTRGAGIWQSGGGLMSDGQGRILFATGNGYSSSMTEPTRGDTPPAALDQSVVRLSVERDGTLRAADFFAPYDVGFLNASDLDFGGGAPVALPAKYFGTEAHQRLLLIGGKAGVLYLLDRDALGGFKQGSGGGDNALSQLSTESGLWSHPAVWPGDGGYAYVTNNKGPLQAFKYSLRADGIPAFNIAGQSVETFGYTSGSPIVTSTDIDPGSALVWLTFTDRALGAGALRAYDAVPDADGNLQLRFEDAYGTHTKFSVPGVGAGRVYVGTADGHLLGYGSPRRSAIWADTTDFGTAVVGEAAIEKQIVLTALEATELSSVASSDPAFAISASGLELPAELAAGQKLAFTVAFSPMSAGPYVAELKLATSAGPSSISLRGTGRTQEPKLEVVPKALTFGGLPVGASRTATITLRNFGSRPLVFTDIALPELPFVVVGAPKAKAVLQSGESLAVAVSFSPASRGTYAGSIGFESDGGAARVFLSGSAEEAGRFEITPLVLEFGAITPQSQVTKTFALRNTGRADLVVTISKPPSLGAFVALSTLEEGTVIAAGSTLISSVRFAPDAVGNFNDVWIISGSDGAGAQTVSLIGSASR